jgi:hypothetical protein
MMLSVRRGLRMSRVGALVGVVVVTLLMAGCAKAAPGVVAYVDGSTITQQQLDDGLQGVSSILQEGQSVSSPAVVNAMIHGIIAEQIAAANKITITDGERDALIKNSNLAGLLNVPKGRPIAYDVADQQIVSGKLGSEAYLAAVAKQSVTLNPRFGVLDPTQKTIIDDKSASLAKPGAAPTP